jgi:hypothetical protein
VDRALAIAGYRLRARLREPGAIAVLVLGGLAVLVAAWPSGGGGPGDAETAVAAALLVLGCLAGLESSSGGAALPGDRAGGRAEWLSTLAPPAAVHRAGAVFAAVLVPVAVGLLAALAVAAFFAATGRTVPTHATLPLEIRDGAILVPAQVREEGRPVEIEVRPLYRDLEATSLSHVEAAYLEREVGGREFLGSALTHRTIPVRGVERLRLGPTTDAVRVASRDPRVEIRTVAARAVGGEVPFALNLLAAGLLVGLAAACAAPVGVLVSRATSAPTAVLLTAVLLLLGVAKAPILALADDVAGAQGGALASTVLRVAAFVSPDLSAVSHVAEASSGHAVPLSAFAALGPALAYAAVLGAVATFLPSPRPR